MDPLTKSINQHKFEEKATEANTLIDSFYMIGAD